MKKIFWIVSLFMIPTLWATAPVVTNVSVAQRTDGSMLVDINYDVTDEEGDALTISLNLSTDAGQTFSISPDPANMSGDIGEGILPGTGKHIEWNIGLESIALDNSNFMMKVVADDAPPLPENWAWVVGGTFEMGSTTGDSDETPVHSVTLSSFAMCNHEVTQAEWQATMGSNPSSWSGNPNRPVEQINWYAVIKFCNLKSMTDELTPVYSINGSTNPADWGAVPTSLENDVIWDAAICNWSANGYRIPTEAEWEYAARGGSLSQGYTYSGSNNLDIVAWHINNSGNNTHDVMQKTANELELFDMSGNVYEWCWDWSGTYPSTDQNNPIGNSSGNSRRDSGRQLVQLWR